jgi:predicted AlkP superfamily phosphohydrolase/phosphomutase
VSLVVFNFDSAAEPLVERLLEQGRLETLAGLRERGTRFRLVSPGDRFAASAYSTLYSGRSIAQTGLYYPFQWLAAEQRVCLTEDLPAPRSVWDRLTEAGRRALVVDPYETLAPARMNGLFVGGWQFVNRLVLPRASVPPAAYRRLKRSFGKGPSVEEVFGRPSAGALLRMREHLVAGPGRVARLAVDALAQDRYDLVWLSFPSVHLAGHQFWDVAHLAERERERALRAGIDGALASVYEATDVAMGEVLEALGDEAAVCVFSPLGMTVNTSLADLLPRMLSAALDRERDRRRTPGRSIWRLRAMVPAGARAAVARAMPRRTALKLTARMEIRSVDWSNVRAFAVPGDGVGYVRLNLRGRERRGIVAPGEVDALVEEIRSGLLTFAHADGSRCVEAVEKTVEVVAPGERFDLLPDLLVRWSNRPSASVTAVTSHEFGRVVRHGSGSGRSGNHDGASWAVVTPGGGIVPHELPTAPDISSIPATVLAALGVEGDGIDAPPLAG